MQRMTEEGIFSLYFASEYLLRDVVRDSTIDIMHVWFCGGSRYLFSWVSDHFIPEQFSWAQLNAAVRSHPWLRGQRIPDLHQTKGDSRGSCSIHLNATQMMHFALARYVATYLAASLATTLT